MKPVTVIRHTILMSMIMFCVALFCFLVTSSSTFAADPLMPNSGFCAHRGDNHSWPENTVPAFLAAAEKGAQQVEFDVCETKDGHLVIMHDSTVNRTTDGTGAVSELTLEQIRRLDAGVKKGPQFAGTKVPTFDEAIDCLPRNIWINLHLKGSIAVRVAQLVQQKGRLHQAFLATSLSEIKKARQAVPGILVCNMSRQADNSLYVNQTIENKCDFIQLTRMCTPEEIQALHAAGVKINYFFANTPEALKLQREAGIDFPLTDRLDLAL